MISGISIMLINVLPRSIVRMITRRIIDRKLSKYADITCKGSDILNQINEPVIFVCNHLSNADGLILNKVLSKINPTFVAGIKLSENKLTKLAYNVIKTTSIKPNSPDKEGLKNMINLVKSGESLLIFPEGTRSRKGSLIQAKRGILFIAKLTKVPIVPIGLTGTEVLLAINSKDQMSKETFRYADIEVNIGKPFDLPKKNKDLDRKDYEKYATDYIMNKIAELLPKKYKGVYSNDKNNMSSSDL